MRRIHSLSGSQGVLVIAFALITLLSKSTGQLYIDHPPVNTTVLLGKNATFHCSSASDSTSASSAILWFMNETLIHELPDQYNTLVLAVSTQRKDGINGATSMLTVLGSELTNGTQYKCGVLDLTTISIVNNSTLVILKVQGLPLPPTNLRVDCSAKLGAYVVRFTWIPPTTQYDETDDNRPNLSYIVYAERISSPSQPASLLYHSETTMLSKDIPLKQLINVRACNCSIIIFHVKAKFSEIGEGNASSIEFDVHNTEEKCRTDTREALGLGGLSSRTNDNSGVIIAISVSIPVGIVLIITVIIISLVCIYKQKHQNQNQSKMSNHDQDSKMEMKANDAYEATNRNVCAIIATPELEDLHTYECIANQETMTGAYKNPPSSAITREE